MYPCQSATVWPKDGEQIEGGLFTIMTTMPRGTDPVTNLPFSFARPHGCYIANGFVAWDAGSEPQHTSVCVFGR